MAKHISICYSVSYQLLKIVSNALQWIFQQHVGVVGVTHVLDLLTALLPCGLHTPLHDHLDRYSNVLITVL